MQESDIPTRPQIVRLNDKKYVIDHDQFALRNVDDASDKYVFPDGDELNEAVYWAMQLQFVVGKTVIAGIVKYDDDGNGCVPELHFSDGSILAIFADEEMNAPGRFAYKN